uniref:Uncharacterized protein n=1 Tax=Ditylenchus dipsaci TaxID=166011 RepID=A0A915D0X4_9BILA
MQGLYGEDGKSAKNGVCRIRVYVINPVQRQFSVHCTWGIFNDVVNRISPLSNKITTYEEACDSIGCWNPEPEQKQLNAINAELNGCAANLGKVLLGTLEKKCKLMNGVEHNCSTMMCYPANGGPFDCVSPTSKIISYSLIFSDAFSFTGRCVQVVGI